MAGMTVKEFLTAITPIISLHERSDTHGTNNLIIEITSGYHFCSTDFCARSKKISIKPNMSDYYLYESFQHVFLGKQIYDDKGKSKLKTMVALDLKVDEWSLIEENRDNCNGYNVYLKIKIDDEIEKQLY